MGKKHVYLLGERMPNSEDLITVSVHLTREGAKKYRDRLIETYWEEYHQMTGEAYKTFLLRMRRDFVIKKQPLRE